MTDRVTITMLEDGIADVRMTRVDKMNALDATQWAALVEAVETLKEAATFVRENRLGIWIMPEGTRSRVEKWKTGFLRIAQLADVPVVQLSWDYPSRTIHLGPVAEVSGDAEADIVRIRAYYRAFTGRNPENQSP